MQAGRGGDAGGGGRTDLSGLVEEIWDEPCRGGDAALAVVASDRVQ